MCYYIVYYNIMGPLSYMRSVVDRNVVVRRLPLFVNFIPNFVAKYIMLLLLLLLLLLLCPVSFT